MALAFTVIEITFLEGTQVEFLNFLISFLNESNNYHYQKQKYLTNSDSSGKTAPDLI